MKDEVIIISLGGSMIVPDKVDTEFLKDFKELIISHVDKGKKFVIITGGGKVFREFRDAAQQISDVSKTDTDWLGIAFTKVNAQLLRMIFGDEYAEKEIMFNPSSPINFSKPIVFGTGWEPGHSTDVDAILAAKNVGAKKVVNLSNTDYVYDSDPKLNPDAKKLEQISWGEYRKLIPSEWVHSGLNTPFDPIASKMADESGIEVVIMNGKPIENLANYLEGKSFKGTIIS